jgi:hypothetical protein
MKRVAINEMSIPISSQMYRPKRVQKISRISYRVVDDGGITAKLGPTDIINPCILALLIAAQ